MRPNPSAHAAPASLEPLDGGGAAELPACARRAAAGDAGGDARGVGSKGRGAWAAAGARVPGLRGRARALCAARARREGPPRRPHGRPPDQALVRAVGRGCARLRRAVARTGRDDIAALRFADVAFLRTRAPPNASRMAGGPLQIACEAAAASIHRLAELAEAMRVGARTDLLELLLAEWSVERGRLPRLELGKF